MPFDKIQLQQGPEAVLVGLARAGNRAAFAELVRRRQPWIRNLMRRFCGNLALADDLSQEVFLTAWRAVPQLERPSRFAAWLKRIAISVWLQHVRRRDPLRDPTALPADTAASAAPTGLGMDLDRALSVLAEDARLCIVLAYHESMTHEEIVELTGMPLGTVKSHIRRGSETLREILDAYARDGAQEVSA